MSLTFRSSSPKSSPGSKTERTLTKSTSFKNSEGHAELCLGRLKESNRRSSFSKLENFANILPTVTVGGNKIQSSQSSFCLGSLSAQDRVLGEALEIFKRNQQKVLFFYYICKIQIY